jgi:hypothetical protein
MASDLGLLVFCHRLCSCYFLSWPLYSLTVPVVNGGNQNISRAASVLLYDNIIVHSAPSHCGIKLKIVMVPFVFVPLRSRTESQRTSRDFLWMENWVNLWAVSQAFAVDPRRCSLFSHLVSHVRVSLPLPPFIGMFRLWCSKIPSLRLLAAGVSSSLRRPCCPLSSLNPSFTRNPITTTASRLPSRRLSNMLDPKSLMEDMESELFNYTTRRFL